MNTEININSKAQFIEDIKRWALLDNQLKIVNEKTKKMRDLKSELSEKIRKYMIDNNISNNKIKLSDGELWMYEKKSQTPLTFSYIEETLSNIINDEEQLEYVIEYLKTNREISTSQDIKRSYNK
jgi:hypothetical protein|uniref:Uncharacterized protein n=1 Tax=viral metagenome TaxID=1070528 RepID=A0A6C0JLQ0_9ZZZZ